MNQWKIPGLERQVRSSVLVIGVLLLLGFGFRVANLGERVYWVDEVATSVRVAGYTQQQVVDELAGDRLLTVEDLQHYQRLSPERTWADTFEALQRSPEHTPLYFLLARLWSEWFGSSVVAMRSLSVLCSLLALPCLFGLSWELSGSVQVAGVAMGLLSVSPFFIAYAQEARPYSLWSLVLLVNAWLLLRSLRLNDRGSWVGYGISVAVVLYTSLLSGLVLLGQVLYVAILERWQFSQTMGRFLLVIVGAIVTFIPWLFVIAQQWSALQDNTTWMRDPLHPLAMAAIWLYSLVILFFDVPVSTALNGATIAKLCSACAVLGIMGISLYWLYRHTSQRIWLFVLTFAVPVPLSLIAIDLILHGQASATPRYLMPFHLAILLALAHAAGAAPFLRSSHRQFCKGAFVLLLCLSLLSDFTNLSRIPDYQKARNRENVAIAAILNQSDRPIVLAEAEQTMDLLSLSHTLNSTVQARILSGDQQPLLISAQRQPVFLLNPSEALKQTIQQNRNVRLEEVYRPDLLTAADLHLSLWQLHSHSPTDCQEAAGISVALASCR